MRRSRPDPWRAPPRTVAGPALEAAALTPRVILGMAFHLTNMEARV